MPSPGEITEWDASGSAATVALLAGGLLVGVGRRGGFIGLAWDRVEPMPDWAIAALVLVGFAAVAVALWRLPSPAQAGPRGSRREAEGPTKAGGRVRRLMWSRGALLACIVFAALLNLAAVPLFAAASPVFHRSSTDAGVCDDGHVRVTGLRLMEGVFTGGVAVRIENIGWTSVRMAGGDQGFEHVQGHVLSRFEGIAVDGSAGFSDVPGRLAPGDQVDVVVSASIDEPHAEVMVGYSSTSLVGRDHATLLTCTGLDWAERAPSGESWTAPGATSGAPSAGAGREAGK